MPQKSVLFIVNPISGDIKKSNLPLLIKNNIDEHKFKWEIAYTTHTGHASYIAKDAVKNNTDIIVAVGGDGSINEIATAIVNTNVALAIIPLGSGNGVAYHLQLPIKNIAKAIQVINAGKIIEIDTLSTNRGIVVGFTGVGFEALVARTYRHLSRRGFLAYAWATTRGVFYDYKPQQMKFEIDNIPKSAKVYSLSVYNAKYLGYKVGKVGKASLADGKLNVILIKQFPLWKVLWVVFLELIGKMHWAKNAEVFEAEKVKIYLKPKSIIQKDGDSFICSQNYEIKVNPLSLKVIVPLELEKY